MAEPGKMRLRLTELPDDRAGRDPEGQQGQAVEQHDLERSDRIGDLAPWP